ncbi:hypothetical protein M0R45_019724 [Rubus argutus]|uniref:F-box domain-containing protein n=1 Tax=Rubus argutus TaxID=59490 RepID=A0AAW1X742_RUBAR
MAEDEDRLKGDKYKYSPCLLLRRVLREELAAQDLHRNHKNNKLLVTAVHAVLLDSGFIRFDSGMSVHATLLDLGFAEFASVSGMSNSYTLPGANRNGIVLKFKNEGNFLLDQKKTKDLTPRFVKVTGSLINSGSRDSIRHKYKAGLPAPPCLMSLPPELKIKILESMPGADLAKLGSLCKELRDLSNDNKLWKHKFDEEEFSGTREEEQDQEQLWKVILVDIGKLKRSKR